MPPYALYNEIDPYAADWLERLIRLGLIAPGIVDRRSIEDIRGDDLRGFRQVHFFAGIGVWSYALRRAGISDDTALWTGSCPCQPFSAAGQGGGVDDERHLWPAFLHLIRERRPERVFGEQVASKDGLGWLDLVQTDMEATGYAIGALDTCSAGSGAPHIRQRLRFYAYDLRSSTGRLDNNNKGLEGFGSGPVAEGGWDRALRSASEAGELGGLADMPVIGRKLGAGLRDSGSTGQRRDEPADEFELGWLADDHRHGQRSATLAGLLHTEHHSQPCDGLGELADAEGYGSASAEIGPGSEELKFGPRWARESVDVAGLRPGPTNGFWRDADWVFCRDEKWRPIRPGSFPLVDGASFRVDSGSPYAGKSRQGMLKAFGNAIDAEATIDFIDACLEHRTIDVVASRSLDLEDLLV